MHPSELAPFLILAIPALSLAGIVTSAVARDTTQRWVFGILGWLGWLASVAAATFVALVVIGFSCWADSSHGTTCGEDAFIVIVAAAMFAAVLPALSYVFSSRGTPSAPRPPR